MIQFTAYTQELGGGPTVVTLGTMPAPGLTIQHATTDVTTVRVPSINSVSHPGSSVWAPLDHQTRSAFRHLGSMADGGNHDYIKLIETVIKPFYEDPPALHDAVVMDMEAMRSEE